jgi:Ca2+-transporting ATPase
MMITGDAPTTALAIARSAGLAAPAQPPPSVISGAQLEAMSDDALQSAVATASIFARVSPDHKLRIVRALQQRGEVVAMTGDGVNDASALRAADIGVAMGRRGTDVAREAAALVLLQDSFAAMVEAVRVGRRIFGNLHNAVGYLIAVHVPIVGVSLLPILAGGPVLLLPLHVVLMELIIDPACSLVFEAEPEPQDCMRRPPRPPGVRLLSVRAARRALVIGTLGLGLTVACILIGRAMGLDAPWLRLVALVALVAGNLLMLQWYRRGARWREDSRGNAVFRWLLAGVGGALGIVALLASSLPQLGLPEHPALRAAGFLLAAVSGGAIAMLLRGMRNDALRRVKRGAP